MAKDRLPVGKKGQTPVPMNGRAPREPGAARPAIVIVERDPGERETLYRELSKRYGVDYRIVVCGNAAGAEARVGELLAAGTPVALVIGGVGEADPAGGCPARTVTTG